MSAVSPAADETLGWLPLPRFVHELTIAQRIRIGFAVGAAVVVIIGIVASVLIRRVTDTLGELVEQVRSEQVTVMTMKDAVSAENAGVQGYLITGEPSLLTALENGHDAFVGASAQLDHEFSAADSLRKRHRGFGSAAPRRANPAADPATRSAADEVTSLENEFHRLAQQEVELSQHGFSAAAAQHWQSEGQQAEQALRARLDRIVELSLRHLNSELSDARRREQQTRYIFAPVVAVTAIVAMLTALLASRSITRRFERLERTVERIEQGDFRIELQEHKRDEIGKLARSIRDMARALESETRARDQLLTEHERANERLSVLYDVARSVNQSLDTPEVLRLALTKLLAYTHMHAGVALLHDPETSRFRLGMVEGLSEESAAELTGRLDEEETQHFASTVMAREGLSRLDPRFLPVEAEPFKTAVAVPLRTTSNDFGVLILATSLELTISQEEARLIEGLSKQIGTALDHARLYARSRELAATEERNRLARELHDSVTQSLFSMSMMSQALPSLIEHNQSRAVERATRLSELARGALAEMRMLILELRPAVLQEMGLAPALERHIAGFASREGLAVSFRVDGLQRRLPQGHEEALFRIAQEALNNVARHAQASNVSVVVDFEPGDVQVTIEDDGVGLSEQPVAGGFGLISMRERAEQLGGSFDVEQKPGGGLRVRACVPAPAPTTSIAG